jgi:LysM repeat protein
MKSGDGCGIAWVLWSTASVAHIVFPWMRNKGLPMSFINPIASVARFVSQLADAVKPALTHTVQRGETIGQVADRYRGTTPRPTFEQRIKDANPQVLNWHSLYPDTTLQIPVDESDAPEVTNVAFTHTPPPSQKELSPKERVDAAVQRYQQSPTPQARRLVPSATALSATAEVCV